MKVTIRDVGNLYVGINTIYRANEIVPSIWDYHMKHNAPILKKEMEHIQELSDKDYEAIKDEEIELPLRQIKPTDLPQNMPNNVPTDKGPTSALNLIRPLLLEEETKEHKSVVEQLLKKKSKNGKAKSKK